ncbi:MAG: hypothetical protein PHQ65_13685 [Bacteroidales bacterium]|nr:hypothetical protein [Bacteroidales bacterium]MDD3666310.1 hypothetical protein [Bacteroidales bacterium]
MLFSSYRLMFLLALSVAVITETAMLIVTSRLANYEQRSWKRVVMAGAIPSVASLPWLWYVMPNFVTMGIWNILVAEIGIVVAEAILISFILNYNYKQSLLLSFTTNSVSYLVGLLLFW